MVFIVSPISLLESQCPFLVLNTQDIFWWGTTFFCFQATTSCEANLPPPPDPCSIKGVLISGFLTFRFPIQSSFIGLAYCQGKDIVFRFIIEYSSLRDFGL
jgi:hypothetical protein